MNKYLNPLSRTLVASIFILSGVGKIAGFHATVAMAGSAGLPLPTISIAIAAVVEIAGGLALLAGWQVRWASAALIVFLIPVTALFHASHIGDPAQGQMQMIETLKNLAIIGGLLKFYADASGETAAVVASPDVDTLDFRARRAS
jgi:putative oxidoreductase